MSTDKKAKWKEQLTAARTEFTQLLLSLDQTQLQTPVLSEDSAWTPLDIAAHLLENERGMSIHVYKIRHGRETVPEGFDLDHWNSGLKERIGTPTLQDLLQGLAEVRARTLQEIDAIEDDEWTLEGRHPFRGLINVEQYFETMVGHDRWHARDIRKGLGLE
jgi:hypothetical protein